MANMFDVSTSMTETVDRQTQDLGELQQQVEQIDQRVNNLKDDFQSSLMTVDDSIEAITSITSSIIQTTQSSIEEQSIQTQLLENEEEVAALKREEKNNQNKEDGSYWLKDIFKKMELLQFNVDRILDSQRNRNNDPIEDIGSKGRGMLKGVLGLLFGGAVLSYLFSDEQNQEENEETKKEDEKEAQDTATEQSTNNTDQDTKVEQSQENSSGQTILKQSVDVSENKENMDNVIPKNDIVDSIKKDKSLSISGSPGVSAAPLNQNNLDNNTEAPKTSVNERTTVDSANIKVSDKTESTFDSIQPKNGESIISAEERIENSNKQRRMDIAQNLITVINQPDIESNTPRKQPVSIIGKITFDQIMRA
jgi:hypothetical protein